MPIVVFFPSPETASTSISKKVSEKCMHHNVKRKDSGADASEWCVYSPGSTIGEESFPDFRDFSLTPSRNRPILAGEQVLKL
jgi:hypothetical protein